jgi:hypothetical protein
MFRLAMYQVIAPSIISLAALAAIVLPRGGHELTAARFAAGAATFIALQFAGGYLGRRLAARRPGKKLPPHL